MPKLIKNITGSILDNFTGGITLLNTVSGQIQFEDYISIGGFTAYLQNFTQVDYVQILQKPITFGLKNQYNLPTITLEISY